jgi:homoserine O-acetyltransferase
MKHFKFNVLITLIFSASILFSQSVQENASIGDLKLVNGNKIENCIMGYRTFGTINNDSSNVILYCSWFEGTSEAIGTLIQKYKFIDTTKYYIIAVDALGNGISSSISNYELDDSVFYNITITDMVNANYSLLTQQLKIKKLYAAIGGSMGSMQVLQLAVSYPEYADRIIAYVATPRMSSYDLLWMNTQLNMIESSKKCGMSEREIKKILDMNTALFARTPDYVVENTDLSEFPEYLKSFDKEPSKSFILDNYLTQLRAMMKHDISTNFNGSMDEASKNIRARLFIIVSKTDMMVNPTEALNLARLTNAKTLILNNNCGHLAVNCDIDLCREEIAKFLME